MRPLREVHVIVPDGIDDPGRPSGGNAYDRHVLDELRSEGWRVHEHPVAGSWPRPDTGALAALGAVVAGLPRDAVLFVDGLVACCADSVLVPEADRLHLVVLVHMPLGPTHPEAAAGEGRVLAAASGVVTTSDWTRQLLLETYGLDPPAVHVARPGVDEAPLSPGTPSGGELLCVAAVIPHKGHAELVAALTLVADLPWRCVCAGALTLDPGYVADTRDQIHRAGLADRVHVVGPLTGAALSEAYAAADRGRDDGEPSSQGLGHDHAVRLRERGQHEEVGGVPEALGDTGDGRPGLLVPAGQPEPLAAALRSWLSDDELRAHLRQRAGERRRTLTRWAHTAELVSGVLEGARGD